jgi:hypothetical protein
MKIYLLLALINLAGALNSERLRQQTPLGTSCLEIAGSDGIWSCIPMFFPNRLVFEGALRFAKLCYLLPS